MTPENLKSLRAARDAAERALEIPSALATKIQCVEEMIDLITLTEFNAVGGQGFCELQIQIRSQGGMIYQLHETPASRHYQQPKTRLALAMLPMLRDYLATLKSEFSELP